jgi:protoporphyrinogen oxidase
MSTSRYSILGAGLAGLSAAYHLKDHYEIFESHSQPGGVARSITKNGFTFDRAIHILYTKDPYAASLIRSLLGHNFTEQSRSAWVYSQNTLTEYPYQANLAGLPEPIVTENVMGLLRARYFEQRNEPANFQEWIISIFGEGIAKNFMLPFNRKVWATDLRTMSYQWVANRVPLPELDDLLRGAFTARSSALGPNAYFWYPRYGGIQALTNALTRSVRPINTNFRCVSIDLDRKVLHFDNGMKHSFDTLISTIPLRALLKIAQSLPSNIARAATALRSNSVITVNLGIDRDDVSDKHWIYVPEDEYEFHRVSFPSNFSRELAPKGASSLSVEYSYSKERPVELRGIIRRTVEGLQGMRILQKTDRLLCRQIELIRPAYVIPTLESERAKEIIHTYLQDKGIFSCGRFGKWTYLNMDQAILEGKQAVEWAKDHHTLQVKAKHMSYEPVSQMG